MSSTEVAAKPRGRVLTEARFDDKLETYLFLQGVIVCVVTVVGVLALPFWWVLGKRWARRYFEHLECTLTDRSLLVKKGIWFRSEQTVPLDRIQDVSIRHGPFLDWLGIATMRVDTAGMGGPQGSGINLTGVVDTAGFRDRVLAARDRAAGFTDDEDAEGAGAAPTALPAGATAAGPVDEEASALLVDIRDSLRRIEALLEATRSP